MATNAPFTPGNSASLAVTATTGSVALPSGSGTVLRLMNDGSTTLYFKFGTSAVTAATTDTPILAGAIELFSLSASQTYLAGIADSGNTGTLRMTRGEGS